MSAFNHNQSISTVRLELAGLKAVCYFVCLLALFLSISPKRVTCLGIFLLLIFAPLSAARWLRPGRTGEKTLLLLSVCSAAGVLASGSGLSCFFCFCLSLLFWCLYLCRCVFAELPLRDLCPTAFLMLFSNPGSFFTDILQDWEAHRKRLVEYVYAVYLLAALFVGLILLLAQANNHFPIIFQTLCTLILRKAPLIVTCLLLALFPAAFIYGFLKELKAGVVSATFPTEVQTIMHSFLHISWSPLILLLTITNWLLLLVELYYTVYLKDAPLPSDYRFYDIFVILVMLFISSVALVSAGCSVTNVQKEAGIIKCVSLSVSGIGLTILACWRLGAYTYYHGLWKDQLLLCFFLLLNIPFIVHIFINCTTGVLIRRVCCTFVLLFAIVLTCPKGLFLTQINVQIFIHKYHSQQLSAQRAGNLNAPTVLSSEDLQMELIEDYGIEAVPALTWLVRIEDVTYQNQTLGEYARSAILDCFYEDLKLPRTGDNTKDLTSIYSTYSDIPRYRLPTRYSLALLYLDNVKDVFD